MSSAQFDTSLELPLHGLLADDLACDDLACESLSSQALASQSLSAEALGARFSLEPPALRLPALQQEVANRLAAHRARRQHSNHTGSSAPIPIASPTRARIAAAVAERYAHSESYRSFLAAQAENAIHQANAAAESAALTARAVTEAQLNLLAELDRRSPTQQHSLPPTPAPAQQDSGWSSLTVTTGGVTATTGVAATTGVTATSGVTPTSDAASTRDTAPTSYVTSTAAQRTSAAAQPSEEIFFSTSTAHAATASPSLPPAQLTVRLYEDVPVSVTPRFTTSYLPPLRDLRDDEAEDENLALDDEIAFRHDPTFDEVARTLEIPANLIEFPRQLVATRRARPRIAEGPLREEAGSQPHAPQPHASQLRIFEVESAQLSSDPALDDAAPEWTTILLGAHPTLPSTLVQPAPDYDPLPTSQTIIFAAPAELRLMAAAVDTCLILTALLAFATAATFVIGTHPALQLPAIDLPTGGIPLLASLASLSRLAPLAIAVLGAFLFLALAYQALFLTFSNATPGMKFARIGLCTFADEEPTPSQRRRRLLATLLSAAPVGMGLLWSYLDSDHLCWHDRLSQTYPRSY